MGGVEGDRLQSELRRLDLAEVQHIIEHLQQRLAGLEGGVEQGALVGREVCFGEHSLEVQHRVHRRADLVGHRGEEDTPRMRDLASRRCLGLHRPLLPELLRCSRPLGLHQPEQDCNDAQAHRHDHEAVKLCGRLRTAAPRLEAKARVENDEDSVQRPGPPASEQSGGTRDERSRGHRHGGISCADDDVEHHHVGGGHRDGCLHSHPPSAGPVGEGEHRHHRREHQAHEYGGPDEAQHCGRADENHAFDASERHQEAHAEASAPQLVWSDGAPAQKGVDGTAGTGHGGLNELERRSKPRMGIPSSRLSLKQRISSGGPPRLLEPPLVENRVLHANLAEQ